MGAAAQDKAHLPVADSLLLILSALCRSLPMTVVGASQGGGRSLGRQHVHPMFYFALLASSWARMGTPRLQDWTPWATQSLSTSMTSSIVAPSLSAALM